MSAKGAKLRARNELTKHLEQCNQERLERERRRPANARQVDDPGEAQHDVRHDGDVVARRRKEQLVAQQRPAGARTQQRPVHRQVPRARGQRVERGEEGKEDELAVLAAVVAVVDVEPVVEDGGGVLARIGNVQPGRALAVLETPQTLPETQERGHRLQCGRPERAVRLADAGRPVVVVAAAHEPEIRNWPRQRVELVAEEEVAELDAGDKARAKDAQDARDEPAPAGTQVDGQRVHHDEHNDDEPDQRPRRRRDRRRERVDEGDPEEDGEQQQQERRQLVVLLVVHRGAHVPLEDEGGIDARGVPDGQVEAKEQRKERADEEGAVQTQQLAPRRYVGARAVVLLHRLDDATDDGTQRHADIEAGARHAHVVRVVLGPGRHAQALQCLLAVAVLKVGRVDLLGALDELLNTLRRHQEGGRDLGVEPGVVDARDARGLLELLQHLAEADAVEHAVVLQQLEAAVVLEHGRLELLACGNVALRVVRHGGGADGLARLGLVVRVVVARLEHALERERAAPVALVAFNSGRAVLALGVGRITVRTALACGALRLRSRALARFLSTLLAAKERHGRQPHAHA
ncbi:hypothetical protein FA09DRAFT_218694 [Tilletiopsis washingtonensis]|uniref:Uncharacterized protein n=1 Tax=Tilletiopsis washingtonensis TaxID=58919 RepID=A0A316ZDE1_9BASI|nr:hypothetical protein FA09DRAFT_218694 [Tilletiopsis washingtonensis]PWN99777.1 hypothetical protein FA09DRAFT_218694 [Tilletiopsis washingtonensis]